MIISHVENLRFHKKLLEQINKFSKVTGYKLNTQKEVASLYSQGPIWKENNKNNFIYDSI